MKRFLFLFLAAGLVLSLAACGAVVDYDTPKSEELSAAYDFYRDSQSSLATLDKGKHKNNNKMDCQPYRKRRPATQKGGVFA